MANDNERARAIGLMKEAECVLRSGDVVKTRDFIAALASGKHAFAAGSYSTAVRYLLTFFKRLRFEGAETFNDTEMLAFLTAAGSVLERFQAAHSLQKTIMGGDVMPADAHADWEWSVQCGTSMYDSIMFDDDALDVLLVALIMDLTLGNTEMQAPLNDFFEGQCDLQKRTCVRFAHMGTLGFYGSKLTALSAENTCAVKFPVCELLEEFKSQPAGPSGCWYADHKYPENIVNEMESYQLANISAVMGFYSTILTAADEQATGPFLTRLNTAVNAASEEYGITPADAAEGLMLAAPYNKLTKRLKGLAAGTPAATPMRIGSNTPLGRTLGQLAPAMLDVAQDMSIYMGTSEAALELDVHPYRRSRIDAFCACAYAANVFAPLMPPSSSAVVKEFRQVSRQVVGCLRSMAENRHHHAKTQHSVQQVGETVGKRIDDVTAVLSKIDTNANAHFDESKVAMEALLADAAAGKKLTAEQLKQLTDIAAKQDIMERNQEETLSMLQQVAGIVRKLGLQVEEGVAVTRACSTELGTRMATSTAHLVDAVHSKRTTAAQGPASSQEVPSTAAPYSTPRATNKYGGAATTAKYGGATTTAKYGAAATTAKYSGATTTTKYGGAATTAKYSGATPKKTLKQPYGKAESPPKTVRR